MAVEKLKLFRQIEQSKRLRFDAEVWAAVGGVTWSLSADVPPSSAIVFIDSRSADFSHSAGNEEQIEEETNG